MEKAEKIEILTTATEDVLKHPNITCIVHIPTENDDELHEIITCLPKANTSGLVIMRMSNRQIQVFV